MPLSSLLISYKDSQAKKNISTGPQEVPSKSSCGSRLNQAIKLTSATAPNLKNVNILHVSRGLFMELFACQPQEDILYFFTDILYIYETGLEN
jgi:hypothetical protein